MNIVSRRLFMERQVVGVAALTLAALSLNAQTPQATLDLQTDSGQTTFHIGERISLKATFTSLNDTLYRIDPIAAFGASQIPGCGSESLTVNPSVGWSNPLALLYAAQMASCGYSGPGSQTFLKAKPIVRTANLNEWVRFDEPGIYQITIRSGQVMQVSGTNWTRVPLQSNTLELHIIAASPEWQAGELQTILDGLKDPTRYPTYSNAVADLRYLATPAAIDEMTASFRETRYNLAENCSLGLIGLPPALHALAIASMEKHITEADFPITRDFVYTLAFLHVKDGSDAASIREQRLQSDAVLWHTIFSSLPLKNASARAVTVQTLLSYGHELRAPDIQSQMSSLADGTP